jgi:plastocyanin
MARLRKANWLLGHVIVASMLAHAQSRAMVEVKVHLAFAGQAKQAVPPAVLWLKPLQQIPSPSSPPHERYTLVQENRMFRPHLLVVPVGSVVLFPNADPFFHNVFSLFDGKRFDLGLYEAGSTKEVTFSREGVSYIFCNIHPEMSAVVLALSTPFHAIADAHGTFHLRDVPAGDYELHVWVEGAPEPALDHLTRRIHLVSASGDLGELTIPAITQRPTDHLNKFGQPYDRNAKPTY